MLQSHPKESEIWNLTYYTVLISISVLVTYGVYLYVHAPF